MLTRMVAAAAAATLTGLLAVTTAASEAAPAFPGAAPAHQGRSSAAAWGAIKTLGRGGWPEMTVDGRGNVTVVWARESGAILAARQPAGGAWTPPVRIGTGWYPQVGSDRAGNVTVIWTTYRRGFTEGIAAVRRPVGGHWSRPRTLARRKPGSGDGASDVGLAVGARGAVIVTWKRGGRVHATYRPAGSSWRDGRTVSPKRIEAYTPMADIDAAGDVVLAFGTDAGIKVRRRVGHGWTHPRTLRLDGSLSDVAMAPGGVSIVVAIHGIEPFRVQAVRRPRLGRWGAARTISTPQAEPEGAHAVMDGRGAAVVAWSTYSGDIQVARRPAGGAWKTPVQIAPNWSSEEPPVLAAGRRGGLLAAWTTDDSTGQRVQARYRPAGHPWAESQVIMPHTSGFASVASASIAPGGDAIATFWVSGYVKVRRMTAANRG